MKKTRIDKREGSTDEKKVIDQIRANYDQISLLSKEKVGLAQKVFAYVEAILGKVNNKIVNIEDKMRKNGIEVFSTIEDPEKIVKGKSNYILLLMKTFLTRQI